jgi:hypothetical protein
MAYSDKDPKVEVDSLASRFPKRGIDPTIPAGIREVLRDREQEKQMVKGEKNRYAKGGMTRGDGCCQKGHTKGRYL